MEHGRHDLHDRRLVRVVLCKLQRQLEGACAREFVSCERFRAAGYALNPTICLDLLIVCKGPDNHTGTIVSASHAVTDRAAGGWSHGLAVHVS